MIFAETALTLLVMVMTGLALYRYLARFLLAGRYGELSETDLLLLGVLPAMALVGTLATYLALFHLLRFGFIVFLVIVILYVARREVYAMLANIWAGAADGLAAARRGNLFPLLAVAAFFAVAAIGLMLSRIPPDNVDIWVFHIPLARSLIAHHGLASPQLDRLPFYSNQPMLFEVLFATAMLAVPDTVAADAVNIAILLGFVLLVLSFARRGRAIQFLILCYLFFHASNYLLGAAQPMTDLPRACFSAAAYLFAYRYACNWRCFDLTMSALMAAAAVAGKYTELVTPLFVCLGVIPLILEKRRAWSHMAVAIIVFVGVSSFWYFKNAVLLGNPIYPFLFAHPGITDDWMAFYMQDMKRPFDVADRGYSTNLLTLAGWRDFAIVLSHYFSPLLRSAIVIALGLALPAPRRWMLPFWCVVLCLFWYGMMFNSVRWAVTAMLLISATAFITWAPVADRIALSWNSRWPGMMPGRLGQVLRRFSDPATALASVCTVLVLCIGVLRLQQGYGNSWLPSWMDRDLGAVLVHPDRMQAYLDRNKPGYAIYRYIGQHDLRPVLQPFDNGAVSYASAYNGGHANDWVLPYDRLPQSAALTGAFISRNGIRYFIDRGALTPTEVDRLGGADRDALARAVIARLKRHAEPVYADGRGMTLYRIAPQDIQP